MRKSYLVLLTAFLWALPAAAAFADDTCVSAGTPARKLTVEDMHIPSDTKGIELYVRNKHPADMQRFGPEHVLLFVHGATYPAETAFDLPLGGFSWMDYIACRGWDVYLVDIRGYGRSTRPPEMSRPPEESEPIVNTAVALRDVDSAVHFILARRHLSRLNLMGWSWGTTIMGSYAAANTDKVQRLVLYAPLWLRKAGPQSGGEGPLGAYRTVTMEQARKRWLNGVPPEKQADLIPPGWFEAWAQATWASDPESGKWDPPVLRAPNGVLQDVREYWSAGRAYYDPHAITAPTLIVHGDWDQDTPGYMALALFGLLENAAWKRLVVIGEATHTVIMEKNRMQLLREVQLFLDEPPLRP
ncbi:MAG TPA: alpha/beta fold hydrolase [Burkholderiales bacterium]|nr:alpha/beta fold hydrolase [Burkholderiales bacterium]